MTNREYMAKQLSEPDWIDDGGASYISMVEYNIGCLLCWWRKMPLQRKRGIANKENVRIVQDGMVGDGSR